MQQTRVYGTSRLILADPERGGGRAAAGGAHQFTCHHFTPLDQTAPQPGTLCARPRISYYSVLQCVILINLYWYFVLHCIMYCLVLC